MRVRNRRLAWLISLAITAGLFLFIAQQNNPKVTLLN